MDLTVRAVPAYFASMGAEYLVLRRRAATDGPTAATYERRDTAASLTMGTASLLAPLLAPVLLRGVTPGRGRYGRHLVALAAGAAVSATVADAVVRRAEWAGPTPAHALDEGAADPPGRRERRRLRAARRVQAVAGVTAVAAGVVAASTWWAWRTSAARLTRPRSVPDLGTGPLALAAAVAGWDFIYYWNHRLQHESRFLWAIHVVHHSSQHYNLSTALRQPVAEAFGVFLPYRALVLLGIRPELVNTARGVNLLYQYWVHTDTIGRLGPAETVMNTPSHHRVHHGSNRRYLDRNHGSILIVWDRLFGTFEPESEPVVYGLTKNIDTFRPDRIADHEYLAMARDVARATSWRDRLGFVLRGPGWATRRRAELDAGAGQATMAWASS